MDQVRKLAICEQIAGKLQAEKVTADIGRFLQAHGARVEIKSICPNKRDYVLDALANVSGHVVLALARSLGIETGTSAIVAVSRVSQYLDRGGLARCREDFTHLLDTVDSDPRQAASRACSMLESLFTHLLESLHVELPGDKSIQSLFKVVSRAMNLSAESYADPEIKQLLGGLANAVAGIGALRTRHSSAHGGSSKSYRIEPRHARLACHAAATISDFLLETYDKRFSSGA